VDATTGRTATEAGDTAAALRAIGRYHDAVVAELRAVVPAGDAGPYPAMRYHLGWEDRDGRPIEARGGKLLRPALLLLACEAAGGDWQRALPAAVAVELLHNFTLIHDDIEDASPQRHGRVTAWRVWGTAQAINAGDGMFALAQNTLLRLDGFAVDRVVEAMRLFTDATLRLCEGQHLDLAQAAGHMTSVEEYRAMVGGKSAALLAACCGLGALLAGAPPAVVEALQSFGYHLGMAFQIRDDVLGIWGDEAATGKSASDDLRARKKSYPVVVAIERAAGPARDELAGLYARNDLTEADVLRIRELLEATGAREASDQAAAAEAAAAVDQLAGLSLQPERQRELEALARFAAERLA
jgi:geranylgeranyl diphosphate synthase type I